MLRNWIRCGALAGVMGLGGCDLIVQNPNNPDTERALQSAGDIEALIGGYYLRWHSGMYGSTGNVWLMSLVMSFEDFSSLSNNCLGQRVSIPRAPNDNGVGNGCGGEQQRVYFFESEVNRVASNILGRLNVPGFTMGSGARNARTRAFAEFLRGVAMGYIALVHDSAAVVTPGQDGQDPGELLPYTEVMDSALAALQRAIDATNLTFTGDEARDGFPLPTTWIPGPTTMSTAEFIKLIRSYRARLRANVARTPAERAAVDWAAVIADAQNGITGDHFNTTSTTNGPFNSPVNQIYAFTTWHQMTPFILGMGDGSDGAYAAWIALPLQDRGSTAPFFMVSPDKRLPQGATRAAQQADFAITGCNTSGSTCKRYFVNRPSGQDVLSGPSWGWSNYDHVRFYPWKIAGDGGTGQNGNFPFFTKAELDLLQAEGLYRTGNFAAAAALINNTRVGKGQLPAITAFDGTSLVPGGADCVPKVPSNASTAGGATVACGNMFEALKWEKRVETAYAHFAAWFLDNRGWGDLPEGTPIDWAAPYQDLQSRGRLGQQIYSTGGTGNYHGAAKGTYGW